MDPVTLELNGQRYALTSQLRHQVSERLPTLRLGVRPESQAKQLFLSLDRFDRPRAMTFIPGTSTNASIDEAAEVASQLTEAVFATFVDAGIASGLDADNVTGFAWVEGWVRGVPLDTVLTHDMGFSCAHLQSLLLTFSEMLSQLRFLNAAHGNLSSRDIIQHTPSPGSLNPTTSYRIVDLSSCRKLSAVAGPDEPLAQEDDEAILEVLAQAHNYLIGRADLTSAQLSWLWEVGDFIIQASEDLSQTASRIDPNSLKSLAFAREPRILPHSRRSARLRYPFDFISAEHIASDELLYRIFAESCPWVPAVSRPNPSLLVGPRGCGKSTLLRWLSIKTQLAGDPSGSRLDDMELGAFYVSCTAEIQSRVGHLTDENLAKEREDQVVHYFNLVILREIVTTLTQMRQAGRPDWGLDDIFCQSIFATVAGLLSNTASTIAGVDPLQQAYDLVVFELKKAEISLRDGSRGRLTGTSFLNEFSATLARESRFFATHRITYCLDDYSVHRVPKPVQRIYNRVAFSLRSPNYIFKISAENRGFHPFDSHGARIDIEREVSSIDIGAAFLTLSTGYTFARELLANRLSAAGWVGTPEDLLGAESISNAEFASRSAVARRGGGPRPLYAGLRCISDLCSGDVATLLLTFRNIFESANVNEHTKHRIPDRVQNDAIRKTSREMFQSIRSHQPFGPAMLAITQEFCGMARYALDHGLVTEHGALVPMQQTRIDVDGLSLPELESSGSSEAAIVTELIRRAIFIDIGPGGGRHEERVTTRLMLRRIYLPAFALSLAKNGQFMWSLDEFLRFLNEPQVVRRLEEARIAKREKVRVGQRQLELWEDTVD